MGKFGGILLAGGKSSRMGQDKGLILLDGKPMFEHVLGKMKIAGVKDIIVVTNSPEDYTVSGVEIVEDIVKDCGPLGGIYSGLKRSRFNKNVILSCDIPFIDPLVIKELITYSHDHPIVVARFEGKLHPLVGVYDQVVLQSGKDHLERRELKLQEFIEDNDGRILDLDYLLGRIENNCFSNLNSKEDLESHGY